MCSSDLPDLQYARADERGYALLECTPKQLQTEFRTTPHPAGASEVLKVQARFVVEAGKAGPQATTS